MDDFHKGQGYCKKCQSDYMKARYKADPQGVNSKTLEWRRQPENKLKLWAKRHNLSIDQLKELWESQDRKCAICKIPLALYQEDGRKEGGAHIDHDHRCCPERDGRHYSCGKCVRGLLCMMCNHALGSIKENVDLLDSIRSYLLK